MERSLLTSIATLDLCKLHNLVLTDLWLGDEEVLSAIHKRYMELTDGQDPDAFGTPNFWDAVCSQLLGDDSSQQQQQQQQQAQPDSVINYLFTMLSLTHLFFLNY